MKQKKKNIKDPSTTVETQTLLIEEDKKQQLQSIQEQESKTKKKKKRKKEITKKRFWLNICVFAVMGCFSGIFVGNYIVEAFLSKVDYSMYDETSLRAGDNIPSLLKKNIASLTPAEMFVVAEYKLSQEYQYQMNASGKVTNPLTDQLVWSTFQKQGDQYYNNQISKGIKNVAYQMHYTVNSDVIVQSGKPENDGAATWNGTEEKVSTEEYKQQWGTSPTGVIPYVVGTRTVIGKGTKNLVEGVYQCEISLHPQASVINYVKQMSKMSGLDSPKFNYVTVQFSVDQNGRFLSITIKEEYKVTYGMTVTCGGSLLMQFEYDNVTLL